MSIEEFERKFADLPDSEDATKVFGTHISPGRMTVGEIRAKCAGHPKDSSIVLKSDGSGIRISSLKGKGSRDRHRVGLSITAELKYPGEFRVLL